MRENDVCFTRMCVYQDGKYVFSDKNTYLISQKHAVLFVEFLLDSNRFSGNRF